MSDNSLSLIVAISQNGVIGADGGLPWQLSADLRRFKKLTMGHHILMGRTTLESIGRLLPGRETVVLTRQAEFEFPGAHVVNTPQQALAKCAADDEPFVVGGRQIYELLLPQVSRIYLTRVLADVRGDTHWELPLSDWQLLSSEEYPAGDRNEFAHRFEVWRRGEADPGP